MTRIRGIYSTSDNYGNYRKLLKKTTTTCTPYIGLYLRDLVYIEDGNPNNLNGLINFKKRSMCSRILLEIKRFQTRPYPFVVDELIAPHVVHYFQVSESECYQQSLRIEPRDPYTIIEELLTEKQENEARLASLRAKLESARSRQSELRLQNLLLQKKIANHGMEPSANSGGWKRFSPQPRRSGNRTLLLCRTKSLQN